MTESYSRGLLRWILINYLDLSTGLSPRVFDEMKQFTKSRGTGNPQTTLIQWKADADSAISSLATKRGDVWCLISLGITPSMLIHAGRHPQISNLQRRVINGCILNPCAGCNGKFAPSYCENNFIIKRMKDYLNGVKMEAKCER